MIKYLICFLVLMHLLGKCRGQIILPEANEEREFTYMALVEVIYQKHAEHNRQPMWEYVCGGTIIGHYWILTASHCLKGLDFEYDDGDKLIVPVDKVRVMVGSNNKMSIGNRRNVTDWHAGRVLGHAINDIALLLLEHKLTFTDSIQPAFLPSTNPDEDVQVNDRVVVAGWGMDEHGTYPDRLAFGYMTVIERYWCHYFIGNFPNLLGIRVFNILRKTLAPFIEFINQNGISLYNIRHEQTLNDFQICVGQTELQEDRMSAPGRGDSGGGLFKADDDDDRRVYGIVMYGGIDDRSGYVHGPDIFTRVRAYLDLIERKTGITPNGLDNELNYMGQEINRNT